MNNLCVYSNILGEPNKGIHSVRIFNLALIDIIFTFITAFILYKSFNYIFHTDINYFIYLIILFILGIYLHRLFCVRTTIDKLLFK